MQERMTHPYSSWFFLKTLKTIDFNFSDRVGLYFVQFSEKVNQNTSYKSSKLSSLTFSLITNLLLTN